MASSVEKAGRFLAYVSQHQRSKFIGLRPGAEFDALTLAQLGSTPSDEDAGREDVAQGAGEQVLEDALASDFESRLAAFSRLAFTQVRPPHWSFSYNYWPGWS
jgi:hypothetical protein